MAVVPHVTESIMFGLFLRETSYATAPAWATAGCRMTDYDDHSAHAIWDDLVVENALLEHHAEVATMQDFVRQSVRLPYLEPRAHPNSLGGLLTLALGQRVTTQDGALPAYRHALTLVGGNISLSMAAQVAHPLGQQYLYTGLKADTLVLRTNGAFLTLGCDMLASGVRTLVSDVFPAPIDDPWLRWGDCRIWLKDVTSTPLTVPGTPVQGTTNLGVGAIDISTRVIRLAFTQPCHLAGDTGYRPASGRVRASLYPTRRDPWVELELEVASEDEATEVAQYLLQRGMALEWQCVGALIAPTGTYRYGFTLLLPRLQWRRLRFDNEDAVETFVFEGVVMDDGVNAGVRAWVYTNQPVYLGGPVATVMNCAAILANPLTAPGFLYCWDLDEVSGVRVDHLAGRTLTPSGGAVGSVPGINGLAATFTGLTTNNFLAAQLSTFFAIPPFTYAFWTKLAAYPVATNYTFMGHGASQNAGLYTAVVGMLGAGRFIFYRGLNVNSNDFAGVVHPVVISLNVWHLVVVWNTGTQVGLQIDNGTVATGTGNTTTAQNPFNLAVGAMGGQTFGLNGAMEQVMIWTRALTLQAERDVLWGGGPP